MIAVTARIGGRRENAVWLEMYRFGHGQNLDRLFAAVVEEHDDQGDKIGSVVLIPNGLLYRAPRASTTDSWTFDRSAGRYLYRGAIVPEPTHLREPKTDVVVRNGF